MPVGIPKLMLKSPRYLLQVQGPLFPARWTALLYPSSSPPKHLTASPPGPLQPQPAALLLPPSHLTLAAAHVSEWHSPPGEVPPDPTANFRPWSLSQIAGIGKLERPSELTSKPLLRQTRAMGPQKPCGLLKAPRPAGSRVRTRTQRLNGA